MNAIGLTIVLYVFIGLILATVSAVIAPGKGRSSVAWFVLTLVFPIAILFLLIAQPENRPHILNKYYAGDRNIADDKYRLFLVKKYGIEKNNTLDKYVFEGNVFNTLEEALGSASQIDISNTPQLLQYFSGKTSEIPIPYFLSADGSVEFRQNYIPKELKNFKNKDEAKKNLGKIEFFIIKIDHIKKKRYRKILFIVVLPFSILGIGIISLYSLWEPLTIENCIWETRQLLMRPDTFTVRHRRGFEDFPRGTGYVHFTVELDRDLYQHMAKCTYYLISIQKVEIIRTLGGPVHTKEHGTIENLRDAIRRAR